jgi:predicted TIM-barrel fold metal-dependent hydrolase
MARDYKVVSTDDHITEPPGLFDGRLPKKFADRTPKVVRTDEGVDAWDVDGTLHPNSGLANAAGQKVEEFSPKGKTFDAMRPGCYDPKERIKDMDIDGVDAHVCFASLPGIGGGGFSELPDKEYALALLRAYNDWLAEDFAATDPERLIPMAVLPLFDLNEAANEIRRMKGKGILGVALPSAPHTFEGVPAFPDPAWEPVWDALEETGMPAEIHIVSGKQDLAALQLGAGSPAEVFVHLAPSSNAQVLSVLLFSGILRKHPKLIFVSAESGIGWLPYFIERADYTHRKHRFWTGSNIEEETPSEIFRRNFLANFISDRNGIEMRHAIGVDNIMIGTDYPHTDTSWPDTQRIIKEQMGDIPDDERAKICALNAVRIFGLDHQPDAS